MDANIQQSESLTKRAAWILCARLLAYSFTIALPILLARRLSIGDLGLYKQSFLVVATLTGILPLGFAMTAYYFLPREKEKQGAVIFNILLFNMIMGSLAVLALVFFPDFLARILISEQAAIQEPYVRGQIVTLAPLIGAVIFFWLFSSFIEAISLAIQETKQATIFIIFAQFTKAALLLSAAAFFGTVRSLLYAALIQGVLQTIVLFFYLRSRFKGFWHSFDLQMLQRQVMYALPYGISGLIWYIQTDLHNYFVSHNFGQADFAIYAQGVFQLPLVGLIADSVAAVMLPRVNYLQSVDDRREIIRLLASAMRRQAMIFYPLYAVLLVMGSEFIITLFTHKFAGSVPIFLINITLLLFAIAPIDSVNRAYPELGRFNTKMRIVFFFVLIAGLLFAVQLGDLRAVIATTVGIYIIETIISASRVAIKLGVKRSDAALLKDFWKIIVATAIAGLVTYFARKALLPLELKSKWLLCIGCAIFGAAYLISVLSLRILSDKEWEMVLSFARRPLSVANRFLGRKETGNGQVATDDGQKKELLTTDR